MSAYLFKVLPLDIALLVLAVFGAWLAGLVVALLVDIASPTTDAVRWFLGLVPRLTYKKEDA